MLMKDYVFLQSFVIGSYLACMMKLVPLCTPQSTCHLSPTQLCEALVRNVVLHVGSERWTNQGDHGSLELAT